MSTMTDTTTRPATKRTAANALVIARTELRLIARSKATLISATAFPLAFAAFVITQADTARADMVGLTGMVVSFFALFAVYLTATTTLVTRRQDLFLKRLRSGETGDVSILAGLLASPVLLYVAQLAVVAVVLVVMDMPGPSQPWWLIIGVVGILASALTAATGTAAITPNASAAQISTMPYMTLVLGTLLTSPFVENRYFDLTPGGALLTLIRASYDLDWVGSPWLAIAGLALWTGLGVELTRRSFRWEPRH